MKLLIHPQTSVVQQLLKFGNAEVMSPHILLGMLGLKLIHVG